MATFITALEPNGDGPTLAVKDLIDVAGVPTTAGSRAIAEIAKPATNDARCLAGARAARARIVGKSNLHELAFGITGINESYGTPENPFDSRLIPGGSSSGSAVAVATGDAELAFGTDTGGSIRIPAAFCGVTGLKTTHGRIPVGGVYPLAPSLDTVGPMARNVDAAVLAMALLEPGFSPADRPARTVGRIRIPDLSSNPEIEIAVDEALAAAHLLVIDVTIDSWSDVFAHALNLLCFEAVAVNRPILNDPERRALLGDTVRNRFEVAEAIGVDQVILAREVQVEWSNELESIFARVDVVALPTVPWLPSPINDPEARSWNTLTLPINFAGIPAIALPVRGGRIPPSLQLAGPAHSEELLVATAREIEAVAGRTWGGS